MVGLLLVTLCFLKRHEISVGEGGDGLHLIHFARVFEISADLSFGIEHPCMPEGWVIAHFADGKQLLITRDLKGFNAGVVEAQKECW